MFSPMPVLRVRQVIVRRHYKSETALYVVCSGVFFPHRLEGLHTGSITFFASYNIIDIAYTEIKLFASSESLVSNTILVTYTKFKLINAQNEARLA